MPDAHRHRIRVRYAETDQMGVVHHSSCIPWLEEARIEWLRAHGASYREMEAGGLFMPVVDLQVRYLRSLKFDDEVELLTTVAAPGPTRLAFTTQVQVDGKRCLEATVTVAAVDRSGRPVRVPSHLVPVPVP